VNEFSSRIRASQWWLLPVVVLVLMVGWEIDWGSGLRKRPPPAEPIKPKPVSVGLLPEYAIAGGLAAHTETVDRTLFNPTRRPAPAALASAAKTQMQKGQFTLTGTTISGDNAVAFLKEAKGGKARTVRQGDKVEGVLVAEVKADRVRLTLGDDSEELVLKVMTNPKPTPQPAGQPAHGAAPVQRAAAPPAAAPPQNPAQSLAERRRAARAAAAAAAAEAGANPGALPLGVPAPAQAPAAPAQSGAEAQNPDNSWARVYQRLQQRRQQ
jgi:hypothetical protein